MQFYTTHVQKLGFMVNNFVLWDRSASKFLAEKCQENKRNTAGYTDLRSAFWNARSLKEINIVLHFSDLTERYGIYHYLFIK